MSVIVPPVSLHALLTSGQPFALLDDAAAAGTQSRLYLEFERELLCRSAAEWDSFIGAAEQALAQGWYALPLLSYETGADLQGIAGAAGEAAISRILLFRQCLQLDAHSLQQWCEAVADTDAAEAISGLADIRANVDEAGFTAAIQRIRDYIAAGDTYQVNYTTRLHFLAYGGGWPLYRRLRERQPVPYGAFIRLPDGAEILSFSPELFVRHAQGLLEARPMKGTAAASGDDAQDQQAAQALAADSKNRAENLMIVDLLRNDLGRVAETGSVQVPALFQVNRFSSVLQMTSTIHARVRRDVGLAGLLRALFPCGSITGAPKKRTMEIIRELELEARGIYTGAIGWIDPLPSASRDAGLLPDFCLSVPIRTLSLQAPDRAGAVPDNVVQRGVMGVGAGIVYDSVATDEYAECALKARFLTGLPPQFGLIETLYADAAQGFRHLSQHLQRLAGSAAYFGFTLKMTELQEALQTLRTRLQPGQAYRVRILLRADGSVELTHAPLAPLAAAQKVLLARETMNSRSLFLHHKTTLRSAYDRAWQDAERQGAFDQLFFNEHGHLTEGGRSSVFVRLGDALYTPPLADGVLPGVMRSRILADPAYAASERSLTHADVLAAQQIYLCNALRGLFPVTLEQ